MFEHMVKKEFSYSSGIDGFVARYENYPLTKSMVDYNHKRIIFSRYGEVSDEVNGDLFEWEERFGWDRVEGGYDQVSVYFVLLADGTTGNKVVYESGESQPPEVLFNEGLGLKTAGVSKGQGFMEGSDEGLADVMGNIHATFVVEGSILEFPVGER